MGDAGVETPPVGGRRSLRPAVIARLLGAVAVVALLLVSPAAPASAQSGSNDLAASSPSDGATLGTSPAFMTFAFQQPVDADESFTVAVGCGVPAQPQSTGIPQLADDDVTFTVEVLAPFPKGACTITWLLRDDLNQPIATDLIAFSVAADTVAAGVVADDASNITVPAVPVASLESETNATGGSNGGAVWLGRLISGVAVLILFGSAVMIALIWPEGPLYTVTQRFMITIWTVALVGTVLYVAALTADFTENSFGAALSPFSWLDLFNSGWPGRAAVLRLVLVGGCLWIAVYPERINEPGSQALAVLLPTGAAASMAFSRLDGELVALGILIDLIHIASVGIWFGGAVLVGRVVLAGPGPADLVKATRNYTQIATTALVVAVISGVAQTYRLVGGAVLNSSYGRVLVVKSIAVIAMAFVAIGARSVINAKLARRETMSAAHAERFRRTFGTEALIGVVVLAFSGWLLSLNPPKVSLIPEMTYAVTVPVEDAASGFVAEVSLDPSRVGLNGLEVLVVETPAPITDLVVEFDPEVGSYGRGTIQDIPLTGRGVARLPLGTGLPFDVPGTWTVTVTVSYETGLRAVATGAVMIYEADGSTPTSSTTLPAVPTSIVGTTGSTIVPTTVAADGAATETTTP
ncbi:MAG: CopD family protein [Ilumatobacteraceae bacterium]